MADVAGEMQSPSMVDADLTPSEDETTEEKTLQLETVQSAIGVSIGQQQTHLTSPKTPAAEKAAALDDLGGGALFAGWEHSPDRTGEQSPRRPRPREDDSGESDSHAAGEAWKVGSVSKEPSARLPSPWRASPRTFKKIDNHRAALGDSFKARRRTLSGSNMNESLKKYLPFNFPSMPKTSGLLNFSLPSFSVSSFDHVRGRPVAVDRRNHVKPLYSPTQHPSITQHDGSAQAKIERAHSITRRRSQSQPRHRATAPLSQREFSTDIGNGPDPEAPPRALHRRPTSTLRRSNSEGSLLPYRTQSIASSLGDDSRFENVSEQVNSRLKAIKDSWQDSNLRLSVPSLPNFSFGSRDDFFKLRNGALTPRSLISNGDAGGNHRVTFLANNFDTSSRRSSVRSPKAKLPLADPAGTSASNAATHPHFTRALQELEGDVVILGGYRGSILRSAEPPNRQLWVPIKVGLNLRKVDLELGLNPEDEETAEERIIPGGMLTHIGPIDISKRLLKRLRSSDNARNGALRVHDYGYDWRLSPHLLSRRLIKFLEGLPCNQPGVAPEKRGAKVIAHSLGGLLTRHAINQRPDLVSGVIYAGVPQNCINILGPLRNGDDVLLSSRVLTAQVNFTIRTSYALLPLDGKCFINKYTKEEYPVDFFDIKTWEEHRLSPCIAPPLPVLNPRPDPNGSSLSVSGFMNAVSQALPSMSSRKGSISKSAGPPRLSPQDSAGSSNFNITTSTLNNDGALRDMAYTAADKVTEGGAQATGVEPKMHSDQPGPSTPVTIPHDKAVAYLTRTLAEVKAFKQELDHLPKHTEANAYPPIALIYGKSTPTVYGAKVENRDAIKRAGAYDELAFASGDGVVLAKAAMVPQGYSVVRDGVVPSERGHVTLLGDLEAVGRCLNAVIAARKNGVGRGKGMTRWRESEKLGKEEKTELDNVKG